MSSLAGDPRSPAGRFVMGKNVAIMAVLLPIAVVVGIWALATGQDDAGALAAVAALCVVGLILGLRFMSR